MLGELFGNGRGAENIGGVNRRRGCLSRRRPFRGCQGGVRRSVWRKGGSYVRYVAFDTLRRMERCLAGLTGVRAPRPGSALRVA